MAAEQWQDMNARRISDEEDVLSLATEANEVDHGRDAFMGSSAYVTYSFTQAAFRAAYERVYPGEPYVHPRAYVAKAKGVSA